MSDRNLPALGPVVVKVFSENGKGYHGCSDPAEAAQHALRGLTWCEHVVRPADLDVRSGYATVDAIEQRAIADHRARCAGKEVKWHLVKVAFLQDGLRTDICWAQRKGDQQPCDGTCEHEIEAASQVEAERSAVHEHQSRCQP